MASRRAGALASVLITAVSVATSHLVAAAVAPAYSPFFVIGNQIIDLTPTPVKNWAIETLGTYDKPVLLGSIGLGTIVLVAIAGAVWSRKQTALRVFITLFSMVPLLMLFTGRAITWEAFLPALALIAVAQGLLWMVWKKLRWEIEDIIKTPQPEPAISRRGLLGASAVAVAFTAVAGFAGQALIAAKTTLGNIALPRPRTVLPPKVSELDSIPGISPLVTPTKDFYRVDINLSVPIVDHSTWALELKRKGYDTVRYSYDDLLAMDLVERDITLACVSNSVGGPYVSSGRWLGVDLRTLLAPFAPDDEAVDQIFSTSTDGYTSSSDLRAAMDGRESMVAVGLNGEVLPRDHGFPARLLVPGLYGFVGATKWLKSLELTTYEAKQSYWTKKDWATDAPIKPQTRIDTPEAFKDFPAGEVMVAGVAWAGVRGVAEVHVQVDGKSWQRAMVGKPKGGQSVAPGKPNDSDYWVQWALPVKLASGQHTLRARCITHDGEVQTAVRANPFPEGASGVQSLIVTAT